jgi:hypothetical protein
MKTSSNLCRMKQLHPEADLELIESWVRGIQKELQAHPDQWESVISRLRGFLANALQISGPYSCSTSTPDDEIDRLASMYL